MIISADWIELLALYRPIFLGVFTVLSLLYFYLLLQREFKPTLFLVLLIPLALLVGALVLPVMAGV